MMVETFEWFLDQFHPLFRTEESGLCEGYEVHQNFTSKASEPHKYECHFNYVVINGDVPLISVVFKMLYFKGSTGFSIDAENIDRSTGDSQGTESLGEAASMLNYVKVQEAKHHVVKWIVAQLDKNALDR